MTLTHPFPILMFRRNVVQALYSFIKIEGFVEECATPLSRTHLINLINVNLKQSNEILGPPRCPMDRPFQGCNSACPIAVFILRPPQYVPIEGVCRAQLGSPPISRYHLPGRLGFTRNRFYGNLRSCFKFLSALIPQLKPQFSVCRMKSQCLFQTLSKIALSMR